MANAIAGQIPAVVYTSTGGVMTATLPALPAVGSKSIVAVTWADSVGTPLPAVSGWTKVAEYARAFVVTAFYYKDVTAAGDQAPARFFTFPATGPVASIRDMWNITGAVAGGPGVNIDGRNDQAQGITGSTGTTPVPAGTGYCYFGIVAQNSGNGGESADAAYPTNGFVASLPDTSTVHRSISVYKLNAPQAAQESTVKWVSTRTQAGSIIGFAPTAAPPPANIAPTADAGPDQVKAQSTTCTFAGSGSDPDGTIAAYEWTPPFGITMSSTSVAAPTWAIGTATPGDYSFSFRVRDNGGLWSLPDLVTITVQGPPPPPPTPGVTAVPVFVDLLNVYTAPINAATRIVRLVRTGGSGTGTGGGVFPFVLPFTLGGGGSGSGDSSYVRKVYSGPGVVGSWSAGGSTPSLVLERSLDRGVTTSPIRGVGVVPSDEATLTVIDHEAPSALVYMVRARAVDESSGLFLASEWTEWTSITPVADSWWLKDPNAPERNVAVSVGDWDPQRPLPGGAFPVAGREFPVTSAGQIGSWSGMCTFNVLDRENYDAIMAMVLSRRVLLLQSVLGQQWYVRAIGNLSEKQLRGLPTVDEITPVRHLFRVPVPFVQTGMP